MAFKLRVKFHGIIAAVPSADGDQFTLLMAKAERLVVKEQVAYVRFPLDSYKSGATRPVEDRDSPKDNLRHVVLNQEHLTIEVKAAARDLELQVNNLVDATSSTPTSYDNDSLRWLAHIETLASGSGDIAATYFTAPQTARPLLIARVDLTQGRLSTTGADELLVPFRTISSGVQRGSAVTPSGPVTKIPIARELVLELDVDDDHFVLRSEGFDGSRDPNRDMRFEATDELEIVIGNESPADIFTVNEALEPIAVVASKCMTEFIHYFRMCEVVPSTPMVPFLSARPGVETCCSVCLYNPSTAVKAKASSSTETPAPEPLWSVLAYIACDNSLSDAAKSDLDEMEDVDPGTIGVVVQVDRGEKAERLALSPGGFASLPEETPDEINFGKASSLTEFIQFGKRARPAKYTAVFFPTHGTGLLDSVKKRLAKENITDFIYIKRALQGARNIHFEKRLHLLLAPDASTRDFLNNAELETGIRGALGDDGPFAILGFDACMMGMVEIAYQLRHCGQYLVASEDDIRVEGWPYSTVLTTIAETTTPLAGAMAIVTAYGTANAADALATLSAVDLSQMGSLAQSLDALGKLLQPLVSSQMDALAKARQDARAFATFHYIDLYGFVDALRVRLSTSMKGEPRLRLIETAIETVLKGISSAVMSKTTSAGANGLSVYIPNSRVAPEYHSLFMSKAAPWWHDFVVAYGAYRS